MLKVSNYIKKIYKKCGSLNEFKAKVSIQKRNDVQKTTHITSAKNSFFV